MMLYKIIPNIRNIEEKQNKLMPHTPQISRVSGIDCLSGLHTFVFVFVYSCSQWCGVLNEVSFALLNCNQSDLSATPKHWFAVSTLWMISA